MMMLRMYKLLGWFVLRLLQEDAEAFYVCLSSSVKTCYATTLNQQLVSQLKAMLSYNQRSPSAAQNHSSSE